MSTTTANLGLFKYTDTDVDTVFDFHTALNDNWDKIDNSFGDKDTFLAIYDLTSFNDILTAYNAGKTLVCMYDGTSAQVLPEGKTYSTSYQVYIDAGGNVTKFYFIYTYKGSNVTLYGFRIDNTNNWSILTDDVQLYSSAVRSVNNINPVAGNVTLSIPTVPTNVSAFTNDAGYTTNTGTITGITMNGASKGTSGVVDLGTVITSHQDISRKEDVAKNITTLARTGTIALADNSINVLYQPTGAVTFSLPSTPDTSKFHQILVQLKMGSTNRTLNLGTSWYFNGKVPTTEAYGTYNFIFEYCTNLGSWVVGYVPIIEEVT